MRARLVSGADRFSTASPSATGPLMLKIGRFPSLGRGSDHRLTEYAYSHFGGPSVAFHSVREGAGKRHHQRGAGIDHADTTIDGGIALIITGIEE